MKLRKMLRAIVARELFIEDQKAANQALRSGARWFSSWGSKSSLILVAAICIAGCAPYVGALVNESVRNNDRRATVHANELLEQHLSLIVWKQLHEQCKAYIASQGPKFFFPT